MQSVILLLLMNSHYMGNISFLMMNQKRYNNIKKQPPRGVLEKRCDKNMQQIYRRAAMQNCDFIGMGVLL